ncbi:MAG: hypothetical protein ACTSXK_06710 [Promethearchaeota archaeon]
MKKTQILNVIAATHRYAQIILSGSTIIFIAKNVFIGKGKSAL